MLERSGFIVNGQFVILGAVFHNTSGKGGFAVLHYELTDAAGRSVGATDATVFVRGHTRGAADGQVDAVAGRPPVRMNVTASLHNAQPDDHPDVGVKTSDVQLLAGAYGQRSLTAKATSTYQNGKLDFASLTGICTDGGKVTGIARDTSTTTIGPGESLTVQLNSVYGDAAGTCEVFVDGSPST